MEQNKMTEMTEQTNMTTNITTNITIEERFAQIEQTIEKLQDASTSLEESFQLYESGMKQIASCNQEIDEIEKKIQILSEE